MYFDASARHCGKIHTVQIVKETARPILADHPADFAHQTVRLFWSLEERNRIGAGARKLVEENFSWTAMARTFEECLERLNHRKAVGV